MEARWRTQRDSEITILTLGLEAPVEILLRHIFPEQARIFRLNGE